MQKSRLMMRTWLANTFIFIAASLATGKVATAQITRDVGEIAVIEGDNNIIFTPIDSIGNPCPQVSVNIQQLARRFYQTHDDEFQFLIMFTNFNHLLSPDPNCNEGASAFHMLVANSIKGIGRGIADWSAQYGSSGVLESFLNMNNVNVWPADPTQRFGNNSMLSLMGQEAGHRWLAFVQFDSDAGSGINASNDLLGRTNDHWSFFHHTASATSSVTNPEASSVEGNFWQSMGGGQFQTATVTDGFSALDLYLMGLLPANQVPQFWYISNPNNVNPPANPASAPAAGTQARGNQTFVTIQNIIDVEGARDPGFATSPKIFRQAFILLTQQGVDVTQAELNQIERYRVAWENYFAEKTQNRGAVITNLDNVVFVNGSHVGMEDGTVDNPYNSVREGRDNSSPGGTLVITAGNYPENLTFTSSLTLRAVLGKITIGQ